MKTVGVLSLLVICVLYVVSANGQNSVSGGSTQPAYGPAFDEIVVNSSLNIKKRVGPKRQVRSAIPIAEYVRVKRQNHRRPGKEGGHRPNFGNQQGFGSAAANAQAQGFQSGGPEGFGASAANTQTQAFNAGPNGIQGSAGAAGSQKYNLPNGHQINLVYSNGVSFGSNGRPVISNANAISYT